MIAPLPSSRRPASRRALVAMVSVLGFTLLVLAVQFTPYAVLPAERNGTLAGIACGMAAGLVLFGIVLPRRR